VRLVNDLPCEDCISAFRLHLHPFEGYSVRGAELASHNYAVDGPISLPHYLFTAVLHISCFAERSARQDGSSSPIGEFPLGDLWICEEG
jgi:hypothetical protein